MKTRAAPAVPDPQQALGPRLERLREILRECGSVCIGYSGGVDSVFLAKFAVDTLGVERVLAVTGRSPAYPDVQYRVAAECARRFGIPHEEIDTAELDDPDYAANPANRCYYCKSELWPRLRAVAQDRGLRVVLDGSNADDEHDYRPGFDAARENAVRSPLLEAGLTKEDIRTESRRLGLPTWDQPSSPCLASRLPYGVAVTRPRLRQVEEAERVMREFGFTEFRVRHHDDCLRLEVSPAEMEAAARQAAPLHRNLAEVGVPRILLDVEGYRRGALNEALVQLGGGRGDQALPPHDVAGFHRDICVVAGGDAGQALAQVGRIRGAGFRYIAVDLAAVAMTAPAGSSSGRGDAP